MMVAKGRYLSVARLGSAECSKIRYAGFSFLVLFCATFKRQEDDLFEEADWEKVKAKSRSQCLMQEKRVYILCSCCRTNE